MLYQFVQAKKLLLILDNCEHLIEACAQLVFGLLAHAQDLRILATSREVLGITGEVVYPVSGLNWPAQPQEGSVDGKNEIDPRGVLDYDAVRLFTVRAQAAAPNFQLTAKNVRDTIEICRRLDGLPLALELVSARVNVLTVQEIAHRLRDRFNERSDSQFDLLAAGPHSGYPPRHQTLHTAVDWSFALLSEIVWIVLLTMAGLMTISYLIMLFAETAHALFTSYTALSLYGFLVLLIPFRECKGGPGWPPGFFRLLWL